VSNFTLAALDIETVPISESASLWQRRRDDEFPPIHTHKIVAATYAAVDSKGKFTLVELGDNNVGERLLLKRIVPLIDQDDQLLYTFNGRAFDLLVVTHRLLNYGMDLSWFYNSKEWTYRFDRNLHYDISDVFGCYARPTGLDAFSLLSGLPGKGNTHGDDVIGMYNADRYQDISTYCTSDTIQTLLVGMRLGFLQDMINRDEFTIRAAGVFNGIRDDDRPEISNICNYDSDKYFCVQEKLR